MADIEAALMEQVLDIAKRERKAEVHHHSQADDFRAVVKALERVRLIMTERYEGTISASSRVSLTESKRQVERVHEPTANHRIKDNAPRQQDEEWDGGRVRVKKALDADDKRSVVVLEYRNSRIFDRKRSFVLTRTRRCLSPVFHAPPPHFERPVLRVPSSSLAVSTRLSVPAIPFADPTPPASALLP